MDNKNDEVKIDYRGVIQQLTDKVIVDLMSDILPDEESRKLMIAMVTVHRKYGIDAGTSIKIMTEIANIFMEGNEKQSE